jgi:Ser/Thr protein kinase RdoA (MazF antagonist)
MFTEASPFRPGRLEEALSAQEWSLFRHVEERTRATFHTLDRIGAPKGLVHFDFILLNCHLVRHRRGWEVGVIDFDDLGWGYFLYDLCPLLDNLADYPNYRTMRRAFLAGYRSVRALPPSLEAYLPILMAARHAVACAWVVGVQGTSEAAPPAAEHIAIRMDLIRDRLAMRH